MHWRFRRDDGCWQRLRFRWLLGEGYSRGVGRGSEGTVVEGEMEVNQS